jgi:hypothetical protein
LVTTALDMIDAMLRANLSGSEVEGARPIYRYYLGDTSARGGQASPSTGWPVRLWRRLTTALTSARPAAISPAVDAQLRQEPSA